MEFMVSRTSLCGSDEKPCEEAVKKPYIEIEERTVDDPVKIGIYGGDAKKANSDWYGYGSNHRVEDGHIKRDFPAEGWFITINSLEELMAFQEKYGNLVLQKSYNNPSSIPEIEIYDSYRE